MNVTKRVKTPKVGQRGGKEDWRGGLIGSPNCESNNSVMVGASNRRSSVCCSGVKLSKGWRC